MTVRKGFLLDRPAFRAEMAARGLRTPGDLHRDIGIDRAWCWRVLTGRANPGPDFMNAVANRWGEQHRALFLTPANPGRAAA